MTPAAARAEAAAEARILFFRSGGERFALDVAYVREILPGCGVTPVPFVPPTVAGIVNHRGAIYTLIRFARLAGRAEEARETEIVLLRLPEMAVGIAVAGIEGITSVPSRFFAAAAEGTVAADAGFLRRAADPGGRLVHAVDAEKLIDLIYQLPDLQRAADAPGGGATTDR